MGIWRRTGSPPAPFFIPPDTEVPKTERPEFRGTSWDSLPLYTASRLDVKAAVRRRCSKWSASFDKVVQLKRKTGPKGCVTASLSPVGTQESHQGKP